MPISTPAAVLDQAELAWAAGFFDGEGSTMVHLDDSRPGYVRLEAAVPQSGRGSGIPATLVRFQTAVGGIGRIVGPDERDIYKWVSQGRLEALATQALLWKQLGGVKRHQANVAIKHFMAQYDSPDLVARTGRHERRVFELVRGAIPRANDPIQVERAWAAGFFDGEGCFGIARAGKRVRGPDWYRVRASATQHGEPGIVPEVLLRLQRALGGLGRIERHGEIDDFKWVAEGDLVVETVLHALEPFLGDLKIAAGLQALAAFRAQVRLKGDANHCVPGHEYSYTTMRGGLVRRICNPCARIYGRRSRAKEGVSQRPFKDVSRRYTHGQLRGVDQLGVIATLGELRTAVQIRPPRPPRKSHLPLNPFQSQELSGEVVELLAILALRRTKSVVIDHADLLREPFRPALRAHALLDLVADRAGQHAARAFTRRAAADAGDFRHR